MWTENVEAQLVHLTEDDDVRRMLQTDRYWHIRSLAPNDPRPVPLIDAEVTIQEEALAQLIGDLEHRARRLAAAPGDAVVLDTNVLLHFQEPGKIPWSDLLRTAPVRVVVPLRVVEELDAKKYSGSGKLASRARALLPLIERLVDDDGSPGELTEGVTIEVYAEAGPRVKLDDADEEILAFCSEFAALTGGPVTLVTNDTAMRLRARAQGTPVFALPEKYARVQTGSG
jgi:rRNA-processing protein FCF1